MSLEDCILATSCGLIVASMVGWSVVSSNRMVGCRRTSRKSVDGSRLWERQRDEGVKGSSGTSGAVGGGKVLGMNDDRQVTEAISQVQLRPEDYEDVTDWKTFGFRYRL